ncbi:DMT family transporter [Rhodobacteraceae bacterium 2376]|uniref:DMT family transporter n=1 Tax=Rhabdonatronobacter sediminivivens TaxID=2743469 RepID=A0A7Z0HYG2_9RHOB|nr:DMT family transporter [Rhabdonatronobacter sediminivivens]NYS24618.1 DMT family transporter [Rhabdonatronobacter sediminivivens]
MPPAARGHLAMLGFSALVAGSFSLGALVANDLAPTVLNAVRFAIAAGVLLVLVALGPGFRRAHVLAPWRYLLLGGTFSIYFALMFEGLKTAPPVSAGAIFTLTPLITAGFAWLLLRQGMTPRMVLALAIGAAGALWVIFRADLGAVLSFDPGRGEAIYFTGCIAHALFIPMLRKLHRGEPALVVTTYVNLACCLVLGLAGLRPLLETDWTALPTLVWWTILYTAIFASAVTFFLLQYAAQVLPSSKVMAYTYLTPSWIILWELALGHGLPTALVLPGIGLSIIALALLLKDEAPPPAPATG